MRRSRGRVLSSAETRRRYDDDDETRKCASVRRCILSPEEFQDLCCPGCAVLAALHWTDQNLVLKHQRDGDEDEVEDEHREPEAPVHLPSEAGDAHDHEQQHAEQYRYTAHHANGVHLHGFPVDQTVQKPRNRKPAGRIKAQIEPIFTARLIR